MACSEILNNLALPPEWGKVPLPCRMTWRRADGGEVFTMNPILKQAFDLMLQRFGPRHWWPGDSPFEVMVGAILTQNTSWKNVEKAIDNLKSAAVLYPKMMLDLPLDRLAELIKPAGFFNVKTKRLKNFLNYYIGEYDGDVEAMKQRSLSSLREELLSVSGIGPETVDSILLYALEKPTFVIDAYTKRILLRHNMCDEAADYYELQEYFMDNLSEDVTLFNEYHAQLVEVGKNFCRPKNPKCGECPLNGWNDQPKSTPGVPPTPGVGKR
ncbi:MAG: endonuclease III domain-containing protein [Pseudomonadota bacterium]